MGNNKKQTAVGWLESKLKGDEIFNLDVVLAKAKEMEKEQNKKSFNVGRLYLGREGDTTFEQYYNDTYETN